MVLGGLRLVGSGLQVGAEIWPASHLAPRGPGAQGDQAQVVFPVAQAVVLGAKAAHAA
jgi:hypothetical protein